MKSGSIATLGLLSQKVCLLRKRFCPPSPLQKMRAFRLSFSLQSFLLLNQLSLNHVSIKSAVVVFYKVVSLSLAVRDAKTTMSSSIQCMAFVGVINLIRPMLYVLDRVVVIQVNLHAMTLIMTRYMFPLYTLLVILIVNLHAMTMIMTLDMLILRSLPVIIYLQVMMMLILRSYLTVVKLTH